MIRYARATTAISGRAGEVLGSGRACLLDEKLRPTQVPEVPVRNPAGPIGCGALILVDLIGAGYHLIGAPGR